MNTPSAKEPKETKERKTETASAHAAPPVQAGVAAELGFEPAKPGEGWIKYNTNRKIYKPELCKAAPVRGFLLDYLNMPAVDNEREWTTYVVKLTHPTLACDRDGNVSKVDAGEEIMVPEVYDLKQCVTLRDACENPEETYEVFLQPEELQKIGGGKKVWRYHIDFAAKPTKRTGALKLFVAAKPKKQIEGQGGSGNPAATPPPFS